MERTLIAFQYLLFLALSATIFTIWKFGGITFLGRSGTFWFTVAYTFAILSLGIRVILKYQTRYISLRIASLVLV